MNTNDSQLLLGFLRDCRNRLASRMAFEHEADIASETREGPEGEAQGGPIIMQRWLDHVNVTTTRIYDHRTTPLEDSPTFKVSY